ncbi:rubrerythrin-like domain-containing protein [Halogeometricum pallidum]
MSERSPFVCRDCGNRVSAGSFRSTCPDCGGELGPFGGPAKVTGD